MPRKRHTPEQIIRKLREAGSYFFVFERTHDGRPLRMLAIVDEYTRECPAIDVERLEALFVSGGTPEFIRSDNGSEFTAKVVRDWLQRVEVDTLFITPGSRWENGYIESFSGKLRDELLDREFFFLHAGRGKDLDRALAPGVQHVQAT